MSDLILGDGWLRAVHHLPGQPFGAGRTERSTLVGVLERRARTMPDAPFLTPHQDGTLGETLTYARAESEVRRRAGLLRSWGLAPGERVGVLGQNSLDFALAVLAVLEAGGVAVPLSPHDPPARTAAAVRFAGVRFLLHDPQEAAAAEACAGVERACTFEEVARLAASRPAGEDESRARPRPTDAALIFFTSGTTGAPKAVVQSHYNVACNAWALAEHHHLAPGVRLLCVLPLHHVNGLQFTVFSALAGGGHTIISRGFDPLRFWPLVREADVHIASLVPNLLRLLAERPRLRGAAPLSLRYAVSAAAPLSTAIAARAWEGLGLRIVQGYGLSETTNFSCLMPPALPAAEYERWMLARRRPSIGPALPGQEVRIARQDGTAREGGDEGDGEILVRGHCVMSGYLHNPAATDEAFRGDWFHTGDLGYALPGEDGHPYFHVSGRLREIAKRSGAMVSLLEVDEVLTAIPGVADAGAAAFANTWVDEEIAAVVVREPGSALSAEAIAERCRRLLPFAAVPKAVEFVDEVPRTASGKIRRPQIAERFAGLRDRLFAERRAPEEQRGEPG